MVKTGDLSSVAPRVRIIVVYREGLEVAHIPHLFGEGTRHLILGKL